MGMTSVSPFTALNFFASFEKLFGKFCPSLRHSLFRNLSFGESLSPRHLPFRHLPCLLPCRRLPPARTPILLISLPFFKGKPDRDDSVLDDELIERKNPLPTPDASTLSLEHLVRNSASVAGEDAGNLLSLALQKLIDAQKELEENLQRLKTLIEGLSVAEEKALPDLYTQLWDAVTSQRLVVSSARDQLLQSRVLLQLSVNLATNAAEVAFVADAEFVAASLNDKLNKVELYRRQSEESLSTSELLLAEAEAKLITSTPLDELTDGNLEPEPEPE